jgi:hypothetical protein
MSQQQHSASTLPIGIPLSLSAGVDLSSSVSSATSKVKKPTKATPQLTHVQAASYQETQARLRDQARATLQRDRAEIVRDDELNPWKFHEHMKVIAHAPVGCEICDSWLQHFSADAFTGVPSLPLAERHRDAAIRGNLQAKNDTLRANNDALRIEIRALRDDLERARTDLGRACDDRDDVEDEVRRLCGVRDDLERDIDDLRTQLEQDPSPRRRKVPRYGSPSSSSRQIPARLPSRPASPMVEDPPLNPRSIPASLPLPVLPVNVAIPSAEASPIIGNSLLHRTSGPADLHNAASMGPGPAPSFASPHTPTPLVEGMGFPSLLPVVHQAEDGQWRVAPGTARLRADGAVDIESHSHFVLASRSWDERSCACWTTSLIRRDQLTSDGALKARRARLPIPLTGIHVGGTDGFLVSHKDPASVEAAEQLFQASRTDNGAYGRAIGFIGRIRFTPPELRHEFHNRALHRWREFEAERHSSSRPIGRGRIPEPAPDADITAWKRWLKDARTQPQSGGRPFSYSGIPLVGQGYPTAYIEGARALLSLLPLTKKGSIPRGGELRDAFLRSAAALLAVHGRYPLVLAELGERIAPARSHGRYGEGPFGQAGALGVNQIARFLASIGVSAIEAESWRPWATAFMEMELVARPNSNGAAMLRQARDLMRARIDEDPTRALQRIHADAPGNYNPRIEASRAAKVEALRAAQAEAGPSSSVETAPEEEPTLEHVVEEDDRMRPAEHADYDDLYMGPV